MCIIILPYRSTEKLVPGGTTMVESFASCAVAKAVIYLFEALHRTGTAAGLEDHFLEFYVFNKLLGLMGIREKEKEYYQGIS